MQEPSYYEDDMDHTQNEDVFLSAQKKSKDQKENPFVISVVPITRSRSKKLIAKIVYLIQNRKSEEELLGQTNTFPTTFIYSAVSYNI